MCTGESSAALATALAWRLARDGIRYHLRTLKRQLSGAVATVPRDVETALEALLCETLELDEPAQLERALADAGLSTRPRPARWSPSERLVPLAELWSFFNPRSSRRELARQLSTALSCVGVSLGVDPVQVALAGRQRRVRTELVDALVALLAPHGVADEADAMSRRRALDSSIRAHLRGNELVGPRHLMELVHTWKLRCREPSSRRLSQLLRDRLASWGVSVTVHRLQEVVDGKSRRVRRVHVDAMEALLREATSATGPADGALMTQTSAPTRGAALEPSVLDACWIRAERVATLARAWRAQHPNHSMRQLSLRVAATSRAMGYATSHHTVQPILGGHKKRCRGFVYRALLLQFDDRPPDVPAADVIPSHASQRALETVRRRDRLGSLAPETTVAVTAAGREEQQHDVRRAMSREEEQRVARTIVDTERAILELLVTHEATARELTALCERLERDEVAIWDIVVDGSSPSAPADQARARASTLDTLRSAVALAAQLARLRRAQTTTPRPRRAALEQAIAAASRALLTTLASIRLGLPTLRRLSESVERACPRAGVTAHLSELWKRLHDARDRLVTANLGLCATLATRYNARSLDRHDLIQEGAVGLLRAVDKFDHKRGLRFATYAAWWVRHALQRAVADRGREVRLPVHVHVDLSRMRRASGCFEALVGRAPSLEELSRVSGLDAEKVSALREVPPDPDSMSTPTADGGLTLGDMIADGASEAPDDVVIARELTAAVHSALEELPAREAWAIRRCFGFDGRERSLAELGRELGVTRERVRQIKVRALELMRAHQGSTLERHLLADPSRRELDTVPADYSGARAAAAR